MEYCKICRLDLNLNNSNDGETRKIIGGLAHKTCVNEFPDHDKIKLFYNQSDYLYLDYLKLLNYEIEGKFDQRDQPEKEKPLKYLDYTFVNNLGRMESIENKKGYLSQLIALEREKIQKVKGKKEDLVYQFLNHVQFIKEDSVPLDTKSNNIQCLEKIETLNEISLMNKFDHLTWYALGKILLADNRLEKTELSLKIEVLEKYLGLKGYIHLGNLCYQIRQYVHAIKYYNLWLQCVSSTKSVSVSRWQLAKVYENLGKIYIHFGKSVIDKKILLRKAEYYLLKAIDLFSFTKNRKIKSDVYKSELFEFKILLLEVNLVLDREKANALITDLMRGDHIFMRRLFRIIIDLNIKESILDPSKLKTAYQLLIEFKNKFEPELEFEKT